MCDKRSALQSACPSVRPSFREAVHRAAIQVELDCTARDESAFFTELCYIIAEIYILSPESVVKISDETLPAYLVAEIFGELKNEHLRMVYDNFCGLSKTVTNKRAYLRTALYNSVFELEADTQNAYSVHFKRDL